MLAGYEIEMHPLETLPDTTYLLGWTLHHEGWLYAPYLSFLLLSKINICRLWDDHTNIGKFKVDESLRLSQILSTLLTIISKTEYSFDGNYYNHVIKDV